MKTRLFIAILAAAFFLTVPAFAQQNGGPAGPINVPVDSPDAQRVEFLLASFHELPAKPKFEEISNVRATLKVMATDGSAPRLQKRALEALAYWPDANTLAVYESVLSNAQTRFGTRHMTLLLIGKAFGADGLNVLEAYLGSDDLQLRLTAVDAIAATRSDRGFELLRERAKIETSEVVLERIEKMGSRLR